MKVIGIVPARFASTRFPGKPLVLISGKPLIQHVVERCRLACRLGDVVVATDDRRIAEVAEKFCRVEMTSPDHPSGSDRVAEVASRLTGWEGVVNVQGDEPLIDPDVINAVAEGLETAEMSTAAVQIADLEEYDNPNVVKVVLGLSGQALYFSRRTIPYLRSDGEKGEENPLESFPFLKHLGIYGYRIEALKRLVRYPMSPLERAEKLEQLRALENGIPIQVSVVRKTSVGVDVPEDVAKVEAMIRAEG